MMFKLIYGDDLIKIDTIYLWTLTSWMKRMQENLIWAIENQMMVSALPG
jgi:hypothetical protein